MRILTTTLGALAGLLVASHASHASAAPGEAPTAASSASAAPAPAAPSTAPPSAKANPSGISEEARTHFSAGVAHLQDPEGEKVEEAYREFKKAYEISGSPKILGNMGFCAMRLERDGEAIEAYSRYLRDVPEIDADERAQIVRDVQTLSVGVARLTLQVDRPGARIVDVRIPVRGERITNMYGPVVDGKIEIGVRPGHHIFTAKLADHEDAVWEIDAFAASRDHNAFTMRPRIVAAAPVAQSEQRGTNVGPWIVMGIGSAMLVGGAVTGIVALGKTSDIESRCPEDSCPKSFDLDSERSSARTFVRVTDVLLIGGGLVTLGGLGWLLFGGDRHESAPAKPAARASLPMPSAGCGPDGCRASMKVVF